MRLAILKEIKDEPTVMLEYREDQVLTRLKARVREKLLAQETYFSHKFDKTVVSKALEDSWQELLIEFKEETVKLA
jgi:hypothetical protein